MDGNTRATWPGQEFPRTHGWPKLAGVMIVTKLRAALPSVPLVQKAVCQALDFYPESKC